MKRAFTLIEALLLMAVVVIVGLFLFPIFARQRYHGGPSCQANLKQIGLGFMQYEIDYSGVFPPAHVASSTGWGNVLQPYLKSTQMFECPEAHSAATRFSTDYFYNRRLSRFALNKMKEPALTVMMGDGEDNAPTWNSWAQMPADTATNPNSPAQRHRWGANYDFGANYGFADGHVKWFKPDGISSTFASPTSRPTFAVR